MFSMDPSGLQKLPRSEYIKRRAYWLLWKEANGMEKGEEEIAPGVYRSEKSDLPEDARIVGG